MSQPDKFMLLEDKQKMLEKALSIKTLIENNNITGLMAVMKLSDENPCLYCKKCGIYKKIRKGKMVYTELQSCDDCPLWKANVCNHYMPWPVTDTAYWHIDHYMNRRSMGKQEEDTEKEQVLEAADKLIKVIKTDIASHDHEAEKAFLEASA